MMIKVGRNRPCPCGSGKKYKRCCGSNNGASNLNISQSEHSPQETQKARIPGEDELISKLQRIEALFAGTDHDGEKAAAQNALDRIRKRLKKIQEIDPPREFKFSLGDMWSRRLFVTLCRRYNIDTYRYSGQKYTTVMALVSTSFVDTTLWPEFQQLDETLRSYIDDVTNRVIKETIFKDISDVEVRQERKLITR